MTGPRPDPGGRPCNAAARWRLELLWSLPEPAADGRLEELATDAAAAAGWCVARIPDGVSVTAWVTTDRPERELERLVGIVADRLDLSLPGARPLSMRACSAAEVAAELSRPVLPPLAGVPDAAQILGVSRERVQHLRTDDPAFPAPVTRVAAGPLWTVEALRAYRRGRDRQG